MQRSLRALLLLLAATVLPSLVIACDSGDQGGFISDNPSGDSGGGGGAQDAGAGDPEPDPDPEDPGEEDPERLIAEADVIQIRGDRLYALSRHAGLNVIDMTDPEDPALLGRYDSATGEPFEMYLRDKVVYAMYSGWNRYDWDETSGGWASQQSSHIEALDVRDPADIEPIGSFDLPGAVSDSRLVGDVLYAVSRESGSCWGCGDGEGTTITSIAIGDPAEIEVVDTLRFQDPDPYDYGWTRSVTATDQRMYVAGIEWDGAGEGRSTIQVVDISDPAGRLVMGATIEAAGQIESRWQIDEHQGVLRVISQPGVWGSNAPPRVQTFAIASSQEITPLGAVNLALPRPERLRSVRFDRLRAYAITFEQTDPLFTIDLSDPAAPRQVGELEIPGWIYHMAPRGDRLLALGFDPALEGGSLNLSLFDVSDLAAPVMLSRVSFGGDWGSFAEDQDRIHKTLVILDQLGLVLVPYSGYSDSSPCGTYQSGIQLIDFTADTLTRRGVAASRGEARRALVHRGRLIAVSDDALRSFDFSDRDAPELRGSLELASIANGSVVAGDVVVRLASDWWSGSAHLEVVPATDPDRGAPLGALELESEGTGGCGWFSWSARLFAHGDVVYLTSLAGGPRVVAIDVSDPTRPAVASELALPARGDESSWYQGGVAWAGEPVVQIGSTLAFLRVSSPVDPETRYPRFDGWLDVVDLSDPAAPRHRAIDLPRTLGYTLLQTSGPEVVLSHWQPVGGDASRVRFFLDRIDVSDPGAPTLTSLNVPGSLLSFDAARGALITMDYRRRQSDVASPDDCYAMDWNAQFEPEDESDWYAGGTCTVLERSIKRVAIDGGLAVVTDARPVAGSSVGQIWTGDNRVFFQSYGFDQAGVVVVAGTPDGALSMRMSPAPALHGIYPVAVSGSRLFLTGYSPSGLWTLDAGDPNDPRLVEHARLPTYPEHVTIDRDRALVSLGHDGLAVIDLRE